MEALIQVVDRRAGLVGRPLSAEGTALAPGEAVGRLIVDAVERDEHASEVPARSLPRLYLHEPMVRGLPLIPAGACSKQMAAWRSGI